MTIDNKITLSRIKGALSIKIIAIVVVVAAIASAVLYTTIENKEKKEILIWYVTTESVDCFSPDSIKLANEYAKSVGVNRVLLNRRHPDDTYFDVTFTTSAQYTCDIFIMTEEMAKRYSETNMFLPIKTDKANPEELLYIGETPVGISIDENYYLLINSKSDIDEQILYDIFDIFKRTE